MAWACNNKGAPRGHKALTLIELVIAMAITAVVATSVAGVSFALSRAYQNSEDYYLYLQSARSSLWRMTDTIQKSKLVTAVGGTYLVLWSADTNADGLIWGSGLTMYSFTGGNLVMYRKDFSSLTNAQRQAADTAFTLTQAMNATTVQNYLTAAPYAQTVTLATNVQAASFAAVKPAAVPRAEKVDITITVGDTDRSIALNTSAWLRADKTLYVSQNGSTWTLAGSN